MTRPRPLLSVVDDDESVRESLPDLLHELGYTARAFSSPEDFLSVGSAGPIEMPDPRYRHARNERTRSSTRIEAAREKDPDHLHHREPE